MTESKPKQTIARRKKLLMAVIDAKGELLHAAMCHGWKRCSKRLSDAAVAYSRALEKHHQSIAK